MKFTGFLPGLLVVVLAVGPAATTGAGFERQHGAHVHGQGKATLAQDGNRFEIVLTIPGVNLAGFEHPPRDADQRQRLDAVVEQLASGKWLVPDPQGVCHMDDAQVESPGYDAPDDHAHHDDGTHGAGRDRSHDHAEFNARLLLVCAQPGELAWLDLDLFEGYPGNERLRVDVFTDAGQRQHRLDPGNRRIHLAR